MIALWGHPTDYPMIAVRQALATMGAAVLFIDQEQILETHLDLDVEQHATGTLRVGRERVALANIGAVYLRPHDTLSLGAMSTASTDVQSAAIEFERDLAAWANVTEAGVVNRPSAMASNASKPHQTALIQEHGFHVPKTLLTTDMSAVKRFWATHERVIFKSMSSVRSVVVELSTAHLTGC